MRLLRKLERNFEVLILAVLLAAITIVMLTNIALRAFWKLSLPWAIEFCQDCFVYSAFFSIPLCIRHRSALRVDMVIGLLPKRWQRALEWIGEIIALALWCYLTYHAWFVLQESVTHLQRSQTMGFPMYWLYGIPFVAFALSVIQQVQQIVCFRREKGEVVAE